VPLLVEQDASRRAVAWLTADDVIALWTLTPVEVTSALRRLVRERALEEADAARAEERLGELVRSANVVIDIDAIKSLAMRLLRVHALRASDALQLAAALHWAEGRPQGQTLYTLDRQLALSAQREGFTVPAG
jgi:predicted nucleic acid-binding protein